MGEYFPHILSIALVAFSSWLAIKLKFSKSENEIKNSIKKLFNNFIYASVLLFYLYDLYVLKTNTSEDISRNEVFEIAYSIAVIFFLVLFFFMSRLLDILFRMLKVHGDLLTDQSQIHKEHLDITKSITEITSDTESKPLKQEK